MLKVNDKDTRMTSKTSFLWLYIFEHISHLFLVFLLMTLNMHLFTGIIDTDIIHCINFALTCFNKANYNYKVLLCPEITK